MVRNVVSVLFLVGVDAIPLFGVLYFGWNLFSVMFLYRFESGIVGLFNVFEVSQAGWR